MKRLVILGAGACGREVLQWALDINNIKKKWDEFVFLDYNKDALLGKNTKACIVGNDEDYVIQREDEFICAVGNGKIRRRIIEKMEHKGAKFTTIIHPSAIVADSAIISNACIIYPNTNVTSDTIIGKGCIINPQCSIAHDVEIGNYCSFSPNCHIAGTCKIGNDVFLGVGSNVIPSIVIGDGAYVCAGSIVISDIEPNAKVFGYPAKRK